MSDDRVTHGPASVGITPQVTITPDGGWVQKDVTDVPTLQRLVRENYDANKTAIQRIRHARKQRDDARAEIMRLQEELRLWKRVAQARGE